MRKKIGKHIGLIIGLLALFLSVFSIVSTKNIVATDGSTNADTSDHSYDSTMGEDFPEEEVPGIDETDPNGEELTEEEKEWTTEGEDWDMEEDDPTGGEKEEDPGDFGPEEQMTEDGVGGDANLPAEDWATPAEAEEVKGKVIPWQEAERIFNKKSRNEEFTEEEKAKLDQVREHFEGDTDGDGLPNHEEGRLGTDPSLADSDGDGFSDGEEVENGYNPLMSSPGDKGDKIIYEEPKEKGTINELYTVESVEYVEISAMDGKAIKFQGKAFPNSFITLYVYSSDPIVVTVKTDRDGNWSYILDKELEDGEHQVYAAVTDSKGAITAKSKPLVFAKTALAVEKIEDLPPAEVVESPLEEKKSEVFFIILFVSLLALFLALISVFLYFKKHHSDDNEIDDGKTGQLRDDSGQTQE